MSVGRRRFLATLGSAAFAGCTRGNDASESPTTRARTRTSTGSAETRFGYTHLRPDGNRVLEGRGALPDATPVEGSVSFEPAWIAATALDRGSLWAVVGKKGATAAFERRDGTLSRVSITPDRLPPGMPPLLAVGPDGARLVTPPIEDASPLSHPLPVESGWAVIDRDGSVVLWDGAVRRRRDVGAPPDARLRRIDAGRIAVLVDATTRYDHGALGDRVEAGGIAVLDARENLALLGTISMPDDAVIEGLAPVAADLTGDGAPELIATVTDAERGARLVAFDPDGEQVATGPAVGSGFRWRHQLGVAPFSPDAIPELAVVKTPHIGGVVEFYRREGADLSIEAVLAGYSSHEFGSRNLDGGFAADADGDGRVELVVPTGSRTALAGIKRTRGGATEAWRVPVGGTVRTNLAGVAGNDGLAVGVGRRDGRLLVWA